MLIREDVEEHLNKAYPQGWALFAVLPDKSSVYEVHNEGNFVLPEYIFKSISLMVDLEAELSHYLKGETNA